MSAETKSGKPGANTSVPEIGNISKRGVWLLVDGVEYFLPFEDYPWFENATIKAIHGVTRPSADHLRWVELDVDLSIDALKNPAQYPLVARDRGDSAPAEAKVKPTSPSRPKKPAAKPKKPARR